MRQASIGAELVSLQESALRLFHKIDLQSARTLARIPRTKRPADLSAGLVIEDLNPVFFSSRGHNDVRSYRRIGDKLGRTRYGRLRGSRCCQSGSGGGGTD